MTNLKNLFKDLDRDKKTDVLPAYYLRLQSRFENLSTYNEELESNLNPDKYAQSLNEIKTLLENTERSWEIGNKIEQKMVFIMDEDFLDFEIDRKIIDASRYFDNHYIKLYKDKINDFKRDGKAKQKKSFLLGLIQDIQWQINKQKFMTPSLERLRTIMMGGHSIFYLLYCLFIY